MLITGLLPRLVQPSSLGGGIAHSGLGPSTTNHQSRPCHTDMPIGQSNGGDSFIDVLSDEYTSANISLGNISYKYSKNSDNLESPTSIKQLS